MPENEHRAGPFQAAAASCKSWLGCMAVWVTIWATVSKALQKPEEVVKVPVEVVPVEKVENSGNLSNGNGAE